MSWRLAAVAVVAGWLMSSSVAAGPALDRAREALDDLRYEDAAEALDEALREGGNSPEATIELYRLMGEVAASVGDQASAVDAFDRLLALDPNAALRDGVSPKLMEPFDAARARAGAREPLGVRCAIADGAIEVEVSADPLRMAVAAYQAGGGAVETAELDDASALIVVADVVVVEQVGLIDEHGNRLIAVAAGQCEQEMQAPRRGVEHAGATTDGGGTIASHWALWGGVAVGFVAAGAYFGLDSRAKVDDLERIVADSAAHDFGEARALEDDARRSALYANIGFAAAGVAAVVSGVLLYRDRDRDREPERSRISVVPTVGRGSAGIGLGVQF